LRFPYRRSLPAFHNQTFDESKVIGLTQEKKAPGVPKDYIKGKLTNL
jgi:hypothetical protein